MASESSKEFEAFFKSYSDAEEQLDFRFAHQTLKKVDIIKTGSISLDNALSSGGLPKGRLVQYYGPPSSGKTLMAMIGIFQAQQESKTARQVFIDAEGTFSPTWAESLGLDLKRIIIIEGDTAVFGQKCFEMLCGVPKEDKKHLYIGKSKEGLLDKIAAKKFDINLVVLDSVGALIPPGEDVSAIGKMNMALLARFLSPTLRKVSLDLKKANIPMIIINHKKANMDPYGVDHSYSGGNSYSHFLSANIYFEALKGKDHQMLDEKELKVGHTMRATIEKSKFGPFPRKCDFKVDFSIGVVDQHLEIADLALEYDVVKKPTSMSHEYKDQKWVGYPKFSEAIKDDPVLAAELSKAICDARIAKLENKIKEEEEITEEAFAELEFESAADKKAKKKAKKELLVEIDETELKDLKVQVASDNYDKGPMIGLHNG